MVSVREGGRMGIYSVGLGGFHSAYVYVRSYEREDGLLFVSHW